MAPYRVIFSPEADAQLVAIYRRISGKTAPTVADRFTGAIVDYCEKLETFPQRGTRRDDLRPGPRTIGFRRGVTIAAFIIQRQLFVERYDLPWDSG
jgi:toxin ParE1/3/4